MPARKDIVVCPAIHEMDIPEPRLRALFRYWDGKRGRRTMPARADIDPLEMRQWLGNLMLIDFPGDVYSSHVRVDGTNLSHYYGNSRTGVGFNDLKSEDERSFLIAQYQAVLDGMCPAYFEADFINSDGIFSRQSKLILPLSHEDLRVDMTLVGVYFRSPDVAGKVKDNLFF